MAEGLNDALIELLNREFDRIRLSDGQDKYRSINEMADFLGIQPSTLSHYRTSKRLLGSKAARDFADRLRADRYEGMNAQKREELAAELLSTRPSKPGDKEVQDWLRSIGARENMLLVEFRALPAARPSGPSPTLAADVGHAIASGLVYGLLLPFPERFNELKSVNEEQIAFVGFLRKNLIETYRAILEESLDAAFRAGSKEDKALREVASRLRVYALAFDRTWNDLCPGLGYKLFLHRKAKSSRILQWISYDDSHRLIAHDPGETERRAIEARFYPLIGYFDDNDELPSTQKINEYIESDYARPDHYPAWIELEVMNSTELKKLIAKVKRLAPSVQ
jgi:hypothetical protein